MKKYFCLQPVDNGKRHETGDFVMLSDAHAEQLLAIRAIAAAADEVPGAPVVEIKKPTSKK